MANSIVGGLFGVTPYDVASQRINDESQLATNFAQLTPQQQGQYGMYAGGAGLVRAASGLLGAEDPAMVQAKQMQQVKNFIAQNGLDINTPEGLAQAAQYAQSIGATEGAMFLGQQAMALRKGAAEEQYKLAQAQAALREKKGTPETQAEQVRYNQLVNALGEEQGSIQFLKEKEASKRNVAAAGAAQYGGEKIANLSGAQNIVEGYTKKPMERLQAIGEAQTFLGQSGVNPAAVPQLRRALVKLGGGDSQVAQREVQQIAGSMGIAGNVSEAVNQFFTGKPSAEQLKLVGQVVKAAETYYADQYTKGRTQAENVLGAAKLDPQTRTALLPPEYKLPEKKAYPNAPKVGTVQSGYRFKGGNPADQNNWEPI